MGKRFGRVEVHPILGSTEPAGEVTFFFDGRPLNARSGEVIAAALLANGIRTLRSTERGGTPRGIYCAIGHCFECRVTVDGQRGVRACLTPVRPGMQVEKGGPLPRPEGQES